MSVVLVVKVSEGLALAADSATTLQGRVETHEGSLEGILKTYYNARKLLQIGDFPIGVLHWGQAFVGLRTIESLVREWEYHNRWQSQEDYEEEHHEDFSVHNCTEGLREHFSEVYSEEFGSLAHEEKPRLGVMVAGYSKGKFFPEIWRFVLPDDLEGKVHNQRPDIDGKPNFGASWFGTTEPIIRLHFGRDDAVLQRLSEKFEIPDEEIQETIKPLEYQVPFAVMPLQEALEYAYFMVNVAIGRYRFVVGPQLSGGEIELAAITQREFNWERRKPWTFEL